MFLELSYFCRLTYCERCVPQKKKFGYLFRAPIFLGKWYGVVIYFSLYKKLRKKILITKYMIEYSFSLIE